MPVAHALRAVITSSFLLLGCVLAVRADEPSKQVAVPANPSPAEREKTARGFAKEHHPELARLLSELRKHDKKQYDAAIADIQRAIDRLEKYREKQPERYDSTLEDWKLSSRIRLAVARMSLTTDPELEAELRDLVRTRQELRLKPLRAEVERLEKRLEKLRGTIAEQAVDPEAAVEKELTALLRATRSRERSQSRPTKPETEKPDTSPTATAKPEA
jgi:chaperonin cofactor prefoldin